MRMHAIGIFIIEISTCHFIYACPNIIMCMIISLFLSYFNINYVGESYFPIVHTFIYICFYLILNLFVCHCVRVTRNI